MADEAASGNGAGDVGVYVASLDTSAATELCVRTIHRFAGMQVNLTVGDGGSTDGTLDMLRRFEREGRLTLEVEPGGRKHTEWLAHWLDTSPYQYAVFVDSDMEFLSGGWLVELVAEARRSGAALVASRFQDLGDLNHVDSKGRPLRYAIRPTAWLMLVDVTQIRGVISGAFGFRIVDDPERPGGRISYDTGAYLLDQLPKHGLTAVAMPDGWTACYHHFGGMTWIRQRKIPAARRLKQWLKAMHIRLRLARARRVAA